MKILKIQLLQGFVLCWFIFTSCFFYGCTNNYNNRFNKSTESHRFSKIEELKGVSAILKIKFFNNREKNNILCIASIIPRSKIKLEFHGLLNKHIGDFYWVKDSTWTLTIPSEDLTYEGEWDNVSLPTFGLEELLLEPFLDPLWDGRAVREEWKVIAINQKNIEYLDEISKVKYWVSAKTKRIEKAKKDQYTIQYFGILESANRPIPQKIEVYFKGKIQMKVDVKKVKDNPLWKKSPFFINQSS